MWINMTIQTVRKFLHHGLRMRNTMALLAGRYIPMGILMAECTLECGVFGRTGSQQGGDVAMAGPTELIGNFFLIGNIERLVNPVTGHTVGKCLPFTMRLMTLHAVGNVPVLIMMTDCTVKATVGAGVVFYLINLGRMTGVADGNVVIAEGDMQGLVRILMTTEAGCFHFKVGLSLMALGTQGDNFFLRGSGGMATFMAIKTTYLGLMAGSIILVLVENFRVTFHTVADFQHRIRSQGASC